MPCAPHFRSIRQLVRFCTIQDDTDVFVPKENVHCPYVAALWPSSTERNGWPHFLGLSCSAVSCRTYGKHSLPVGHSTGPGQGESELNSVRTPQAGYLRSAVVLSVHFSHLFPVTRTSCFAQSAQCVEWVKQLIRVKCQVAGLMESNWHSDVLFSMSVVH